MTALFGALIAVGFYEAFVQLGQWGWLVVGGTMAGAAWVTA